MTIKDFGTYECVAKNPLGESDGTINLLGNFFSSHFISDFHVNSFCLKERIVASVATPWPAPTAARTTPTEATSYGEFEQEERRGHRTDIQRRIFHDVNLSYNPFPPSTTGWIPLYFLFVHTILNSDLQILKKHIM